MSNDSKDDFFAGRALAKEKVARLARSAQGAARAPPMPAEAEGHMVDISDKPVVRREAIAEGFLRLRPETLAAIAQFHGGANSGTGLPPPSPLPKGDPFGPARIAGILAAKMTPQLIPLCHPIPLAAIDIELEREAGGVRVRASVRTSAQTGVEMEALAAVAGALLTVWDMTKALEKDATGNYPQTAIESIRVVSKTKGSA